MSGIDDSRNCTICPECRGPMAETGCPYPDEEYFRCAWCGCQTTFERKVLIHGSPEKIADAQQEGAESVTAAAYRAGFADGLRKRRAESTLLEQQREHIEFLQGELERCDVKRVNAMETALRRLVEACSDWMNKPWVSAAWVRHIANSALEGKEDDGSR